MRDFNVKLNIATINSINVYFEIELATLIDKLTIDFPVNRVDFYIMQIDTSFLLYLQDMNKLEIYLNNIKDEIVIKNESIISIIRYYKHLFLIWDFLLINYLINIELR